MTLQAEIPESHFEDRTAELPQDLIARLSAGGRSAQRQLARLTGEQKAQALNAAANAIRAAQSEILEANAKDLAAAQAGGLSGALIDRLLLDSGRLAAIADAVDHVAALPDPVGQIIDVATPPNGLHLTRVRVPIGLIGIIYESRPNVTIDAAALCLRSGNAVLLRGGSEAVHSNRALHAARCIPTVHCMRLWLPGWSSAACRARRCNWCQRRIAPLWGQCSQPQVRSI